MQNLIVGERYSIKHPDGYWAGDVTYTGYENGFGIKEVDVTKGDEFVHNYFKEKGNTANLNGGSNWNWELVNFSLEND